MNIKASYVNFNLKHQSHVEGFSHWESVIPEQLNTASTKARCMEVTHTIHPLSNQDQTIEPKCMLCGNLVRNTVVISLRSEVNKLLGTNRLK